MWECGGFFPFGLFFIFLIGFLIIRISAFRRWGGWNHSRFNAEDMLKQRLINGEIDEAEYHRLKSILKEK